MLAWKCNPSDNICLFRNYCFRNYETGCSIDPCGNESIYFFVLSNNQGNKQLELTGGPWICGTDSITHT